MEIFKEFGFEAAHYLPNVPAGHKCARMHGHSYRVELHVAGPIGADSGWVMDFADLSEAFAPIRDLLDHRVLNDVEGLSNPTCELLAIWVWQRLANTLPLSSIVLRETPSSGCVYRGEG